MESTSGVCFNGNKPLSFRCRQSKNTNKQAIPRRRAWVLLSRRNFKQGHSCFPSLNFYQPFLKVAKLNLQLEKMSILHF